MNDLIEEISSQLLTRTGHLNAAVTRRDWFLKSDLNKKIIDSTSFLPETSTYTERYFCIKNNITSRQICHITGKPLRFLPSSRRYAKVSGVENSYHVINLKERNNKLSANKQRNNLNRRQNIINCFRNKLYILKSKDEVAEFVNDRLKTTNYGRSTNFINNKHKTQNIDLLCSLLEYTYDPLLEPLPERINWSEHFYLFTKNITPPTLYNNINKKATYENFFIGYRGIINEQLENGMMSGEFLKSLNNQGFNILNQSYKTLKNTIFILQCKKCGNIQEKGLWSNRWKNIYCPGCYKDVGFSKIEKDICQFLTENNIIYTQNDKTVVSSGELDIYIPSKNIAIELDGLLWHSFGTTYPHNDEQEDKLKYKHLQKTVECETRGIHLLHIFDIEWKQNLDIIKSIILDNLNITKNIINIKDCIIKEIDLDTKHDFFQKNCLKGDVLSTYNYGILYGNELLCAAIFKINNNEAELLQFCNKVNYQVNEGLAEIINYFTQKNNIYKILYLADRRYYTNKIQEMKDFMLIKTFEPKFWYTLNTRKLLNRDEYLNIQLTESDQQKTESEIMYERGYRRIYDCGNYVFEWKSQLNKNI